MPWLRPRKFLWTLLPILYHVSSIQSAPTDIPSAASFYVSRLPGLQEDHDAAHPLHIYSGHLSSDPNATRAASTDVTAHLFFVMVKPRRSADKERVMFWFNGGPGCSSFDGLMMEVGPFKMKGNEELTTREGGWEEYTTMIYVDQPAGTGFSYTSTNHYVHGLEQASVQLLVFLNNFYQVFPEYRTMDTYLGGESYAGQYIPYFADAILKSSLKIPLRGAAIGNGWIDGRRQYPSYLEYAVKHGVLEENSEDWKDSKRLTDECMAGFERITDVEAISTPQCDRLVYEVLSAKERTIGGRAKCVNIYDIRLEDDSPACGMNWPPEIHNVTTYLGRSDVVLALHATAKAETWVECRGIIQPEFKKHKSNSSITVLPSVLERIPVLIFAGDQDFICNYMGLESMIQAMSWNGGTGLGTVQTQSWSVNNSPAGTWVSSRNLTYVKIFNASHMAPYDYPHVAHDMILRFMGVNFSAIVDGSAKVPSSIGSDSKPVFSETDKTSSTPNASVSKSPQQDKAMWEAYYNAGSAAFVLLLILLVLGTFVWCRIRRRRLQLPTRTNNEEESIPLNSTSLQDDEDVFRKRKGKERAEEPEGEPIFNVGDSDDEDGYKDDVGSQKHR